VQNDDLAYDDFFSSFDSALSRQVRAEAYGRDIGQHSWVTAEELAEDVERLKLARGSRLLDLGCGPAGPLTFVVGLTDCRGSGVDLSASALASGRARAAALGLEGRVDLRAADLDAPLPFGDGAFDAVISIDAILHARDRVAVFREVARVLAPGSRFLYTDGAVVTGSLSDDEMRLRAVHGHMYFTAPGHNERTLERAGLQLIETRDRTQSLLRNASGRLAARLAHRKALEEREGSAAFERQRRYLEAVVELSRREAVSRLMFLAEK